MSKSRSIPEELIKIKAHEIWKKNLLEGRERTPDLDWREAEHYLERHRWEVHLWRVNTPVRSLYNFCSLFRDPNSRDFALDVVKTFISAFGLIATILAGVGLFLTFYSAEKDRQEARADRVLTQERLVTDRFSKAVEQLGKDKNTTVRIGGIYALERIAEDSPEDFWTIMEVLTSYVRDNSSLPPELRQPFQNEQEREQKRQKLKELLGVSIDLQAVLTVIGRREDPNPDRDERIDLSFTNLKGAILVRANLKRANLWEANLIRANLERANLERAFLRRGNLFQANLESANLEGAILIDVQNLTSTQIKSACNWEATTYKRDKEENKKYVENLKKDKSSDPKEPVDCSHWSK